jgi:hypothetical protein
MAFRFSPQTPPRGPGRLLIWLNAGWIGETHNCLKLGGELAAQTGIDWAAINKAPACSLTQPGLAFANRPQPSVDISDCRLSGDGDLSLAGLATV